LSGYGVNFTITLHTGVFAYADLFEKKILQVKVLQKNERVFFCYSAVFSL
jgi:hypothetical protein